MIVCSDTGKFVAKALRLDGFRWVFISFYIKHGSVSESTSLLRSMTLFVIDQCSATDCSILGGDANAHLANLNGISDTSVRLLESFCIENGHIILNRLGVCVEKMTRKQACLDYILAYDTALWPVELMNIDEDNEHSLSDSNLLEVVCTRSKHREQQAAEPEHVTDDKAVAGYVDAISVDNIPRTYRMFKECTQAAVRAATRGIHLSVS